MAKQCVKCGVELSARIVKNFNTCSNCRNQIKNAKLHQSRKEKFLNLINGIKEHGQEFAKVQTQMIKEKSIIVGIAVNFFCIIATFLLTCWWLG